MCELQRREQKEEDSYSSEIKVNINDKRVESPIIWIPSPQLAVAVSEDEPMAQPIVPFSSLME